MKKKSVVDYLLTLLDILGAIFPDHHQQPAAGAMSLGDHITFCFTTQKYIS